MQAESEDDEDGEEQLLLILKKLNTFCIKLNSIIFDHKFDMNLCCIVLTRVGIKML